MTARVFYVPFHDARKWQREGFRSRDAHVALHLVKRFGTGRVVVLDRPTCVAELVRLRGRWRPGGALLQRGAGSALTATPEGLVVADCLMPGVGFRRGSFHLWLLRAYGSSRYRRAIRSAVEREESTQRVLWLCHPFAVALADGVWGARIVMDAFDNFAIHPELREVARQRAADAYAELCARADRVVVNSVAMQDYLWRLCRCETLLVANGVDVEFFTGAVPMPLPGVTGPVVGYAGRLGQRIDVDLLRALCDRLPRGTVVIAGPILNRRWMRGVLKHPRIRYVGDLHYRELPAFLAACDVCIVPHRVGAGENHGDATKIYEYLAAGKPVVATGIGGVEQFGGRVAIGGTPGTFIEATLAAARGAIGPRGGVLPSETWEARTRTICDYFGVA